MENSPLENIYRETTGVSSNPKEVLTEEMFEHMGAKAATTPASTEEVSGNINKAFPMATLGEQSSKGPRCQETTGVAGASARQKTSTTKRYHDPSKEGTTSGEEQIVKLKNMVKRLIQKKKKKQFVLKRREPVTDAPKKGESEADVNMEDVKEKGEQEKDDLEGEQQAVETEFVQAAETTSRAAVTEQEAVTVNVADSIKAAETVNTAELNEAAEIVQEVLTNLEISKTLIKAKHDTPKVTSKAKGVVIKERGKAVKKSSIEKEMSKNKGKAKLVESDQPIKKQKLVESDEALARKMQADIEQEERVQVEKDRDMAKALAVELNEAYQQSLVTEMTQKKAATLKKSVVVKTAAKKRQPSKTFLGTQERNKMITFLKGAVGVRKKMFSKVTFEQIKELYNSEMTKLQGNETARVEMEKRMKESNDFMIEKPFPDEQETPPKKEATLGESLRTLKRTKMMARRKSTKKPRVAEGEAEKVAEEEEAPKSSEQNEPARTDDVNLYMVVMDKVAEPISAEPVGVKPPEVILWDTMKVDGKEYIRLKRNDEKYEVYNTWAKIVRTCSRSDLEEMFDIGMKLYADHLKALEISITKLVMEYLCMMFKPEEMEHVIRNVFKNVNNWTLYETSGVYELTMDINHIEYFLVDRVYNHSRLKLHAMLKKKLGCVPNSEMAKYLIQKTINQSLGLDANTGV
ncbi:hypothetical protein L6452_28924 [Arctium lappa]|uniref:Uncharacterized protein n=1 Tax=Arctium lappa TaxID=4217 RepID=A0ACB8ZZU6_ARCLA|nr:hypothetical protein L6452_28924 [Arctium lappa]